MGRGLFVGLITLDCIYKVDRAPGSDDKIVAEDCLLVAGGPATNAAVAFRYLGNEATVLAGLGSHSVTSLIRSDLQAYGVEVQDLLPERAEPPPLSTILVTAATGERAVVSCNAVKAQAPVESVGEDILKGVDSVLMDGHQMAVSIYLAKLARQRQLPVVLDGGSWKPGFEDLLPLATTAIASARFFPPGCRNTSETMAYLSHIGIPEIAITQGQQPILYCHQGKAGALEVPTVAVQDTLGAGDVFHGAFCHYRASWPFEEALARASAIAARSCTQFGTRAWMADSP